MSIPGWPGFPLANPPSGNMESPKVDQAFGHLYAYRKLLPAEIRGTSANWTITANDLNTWWGYESSSNTTWTLPIGLNPPEQVGVDEDNLPILASGALTMFIEQHGSGYVTLVPSFASDKIIKPASLSTIRTDGIGTKLGLIYWPDSVGKVSIWAA